MLVLPAEIGNAGWRHCTGSHILTYVRPRCIVLLSVIFWLIMISGLVPVENISGTHYCTSRDGVGNLMWVGFLVAVSGMDRAPWVCDRRRMARPWIPPTVLDLLRELLLQAIASDTSCGYSSQCMVLSGCHHSCCRPYHGRHVSTALFETSCSLNRGARRDACSHRVARNYYVY